MYLGIEIGGTKLQLGVGSGKDRELLHIERTVVDRDRGATGILAQIESISTGIREKFQIESVGIGFGGPIDQESGIIFKSHQVEGWDSFNLKHWSESVFGVPTYVANDCDAAAFAEAKLGAGEKLSSVLYVTVGTGIGGGYVLNGNLMGSDRPAISEIGHLRPGVNATSESQTVESISSGTGIANLAKRYQAEKQFFSQLDAESLNAQLIAKLASGGDPQAQSVLAESITTLGWAIAQAITLNAPELVVVGGGVSLIGEEHFMQPLRKAIHQFVFPALHHTYEVSPAILGEEVVVHGGIQLAKHAKNRHA